MNFVKRATPWMITLVILLGLYVASFFWYYKPKRPIDWWVGGGFASSNEKLLDQFYQPLILWEEERWKQKSRKELLLQCQGEWEGRVQPRSGDFSSGNQSIQVRAMIEGDQFKIIKAESRPELVGVTWKIGCLSDGCPHYGISSNKSYPRSSSIFLAYERLPSGEESLDEGIEFVFGSKTVMAHAPWKQLVRPAAPPTPSN